MADAEGFKTYDKTPIIGFFSLNKWSFGLREIILVAIAGLLLVLVLVFAGLFGKAEHEIAHGVPSASAIVGNSFCADVNCLRTAARSLELMNKSVDPCENFFEFACGNYKTVNPIDITGRSRNVLDDMFHLNEDRLMNILEKPISQMHDYAAEKKMKSFFSSCNDMYIREKNKGLPFINHVINALGGWKALGNWDPNWDFNTALKKVHADFWVDALYIPDVTIDYYQTNQRVIQIAPGGTGKWMSWRWYTTPGLERYLEDYKTFIRRVATLLVRDAVNAPLRDATLQQQYVEEFVNDTIAIESHLVTLATGSRYDDDPYHEVNKVSLQEFNTETGTVINWVDQMTYLFNTAVVTPNTKIVVLNREYFHNLTAIIRGLPDADRNRMLHNYLIWRVAETYVQDLSWEYVHANREVFVDLRGYQNFLGTYRYCFYLVRFYMQDALSSLFIAEHFVEESKEMVDDITDNLKLALQSQLDKTPWMDSETRKYAKDKLDSLTFKMGHPDWMSNPAYVDQIYNGLMVNESDFFGSLLSANQFKRAEWNEELMRRGRDREEWQFPTYATTIGIFWYWNEILGPAGILQIPIYNKDQPHFSTFGSLGSLLGRFLHNVVDETGKFYDKTGKYIGPNSWWTNHSLTSYVPVRQCVVNAYTNISKSYDLGLGEHYDVFINPQRYASKAIAWTNGIRLALIGYDDWVKSKGVSEKMLPGLGMSNQQMLFLAHAQTFCYNRNAVDSFFRALQYRVDDDMSVNMALAQLPEFSQAFQCKTGSKMNHNTKCQYY